MGLSGKVTVLMAAYNVESYIAEAIQSILDQTYDDFTFLIINDASTDKTEDVILSFNDKRIVYKKNPTNMGVGKTVHDGMDMIDSKYVVRFDADDISYPRRIETLVNYLENNPSLPIASSFFEIIGSAFPNPTIVENPFQLRTRALFECPVSQYIILDNHFLKKNGIYYNPDLRVAEDYDLYLKVLRIANIAKIPEVLVKYRRHKKSLTSTQYTLQDEFATNLKLELLRELSGLELTNSEREVYMAYSFHRKLVNPLQLSLLKSVLEKVRNEYFGQNQYSLDKNYYLKIEYEKLKILLVENKTLGFPILIAYLKNYAFDFRIFLGLGLFLRIVKYRYF